MEGNKNTPIQEKVVVNFLPASKFLYHKEKSYDQTSIEKFFQTHKIALKDFYNGGKCDEKCTVCGKNHWLIWQNEFMYYDALNQSFIKTEDDEELEEAPGLEEIDFAVRVCAGCGAWATFIFPSQAE